MTAKQLIEACDQGRMSEAQLRRELESKIERGELSLPGVTRVTRRAIDAYIADARSRSGGSTSTKLRRGLMGLVGGITSGIGQGLSRLLDSGGHSRRNAVDEYPEQKRLLALKASLDEASEIARREREAAQAESLAQAQAQARAQAAAKTEAAAKAEVEAEARAKSEAAAQAEAEARAKSEEAAAKAKAEAEARAKSEAAATAEARAKAEAAAAEAESAALTQDKRHAARDRASATRLRLEQAGRRRRELAREHQRMHLSAAAHDAGSPTTSETHACRSEGESVTPQLSPATNGPLLASPEPQPSRSTTARASSTMLAAEAQTELELERESCAPTTTTTDTTNSPSSSALGTTTSDEFETCRPPIAADAEISLHASDEAISPEIAAKITIPSLPSETRDESSRVAAAHARIEHIRAVRSAVEQAAPLLTHPLDIETQTEADRVSSDTKEPATSKVRSAPERTTTPACEAAPTTETTAESANRADRQPSSDERATKADKSGNSKLVELWAEFDRGQIDRDDFARRVRQRIAARPERRGFRVHELRAIGRRRADVSPDDLRDLELVELVRARAERHQQIERGRKAGMTSESDEKLRAAIRKFERGSSTLAAFERAVERWGSINPRARRAQIQYSQRVRSAKTRRRRALIEYRVTMGRLEQAACRCASGNDDGPAGHDNTARSLDEQPWTAGYIDPDLDRDLYDELTHMWRLAQQNCRANAASTALSANVPRPRADLEDTRPLEAAAAIEGARSAELDSSSEL